jgi:hypothetical protein
MRNGSPRVTLLVACFAVLAGCGGLRALPITGNDAAAGGQSGSSAGAGRGGGGGMAGTGTAGTGGAVSGLGGMGGSTMIVDAGGADSPACVAGGACVPANPCHKGMFVCTEGSMSCMELTDLQANGTVCDTDKVCHNGSCDSCMQGMACDVTGKPCRVGSIVCATGAPVCTETDNKPNGSTCGTGMVCQAGTCATCQAGGACTPTNKCHTGTLVCSGASPSCTDTNTNVAAGMSCGTDMVCDGRGACAACVQGMDCVVPGKPCRKGTIACNTGAPVCIESGDAANGTVCGTNLVCQAGNCAACSAGAICVPANPCHAGQTVCSPTIACTDTGNMLANGASCGTDKVCNAGTCVSCAAGASCQPTNACKTGTTSCATGSPVCVESGNRANGTTCGTNMVCNTGSCATCSSGGPCTPTNPCHTGTLTCTTGAPTCSDSNQNQPDGTSCGTNLVCKTGSCMSCTAGQACQPTNPCKTGTTSCATGASVCTETGNKGQGTLCGAGQSCANGVLTLPAMCNANGTCAAATMQCPSGCNTTGTDCATCPTGQTSCASGCKDLTSDPVNCGACDKICPMPDKDSGIAVCVNSSCNVKCNSGYLACTPVSLGTCQQVTWGFEDPSLEGYQVINSPSAAGKLGYTTVVQHSGKYSLGAVIRASSTTSRGYQIGPPICGGSRGYVQGKALTVTAWMMIVPSDDKQTFGKASYWGIRITTESGDTLAKGAPRGYNEWFPVSVTAPAGDTQLSAIILEGVFTSDLALGADWTGTMYFDDISVSVP